MGLFYMLRRHVLSFDAIQFALLAIAGRFSEYLLTGNLYGANHI